MTDTLLHSLSNAPRRQRDRRDVSINALVCLISALLLGCASSPSTPTAVAATPTRAERAVAALSALGFAPQSDGWYLTLPAPLVFDFDSDAVSDRGRTDVTRVARELTALEVDRVFVYGHTDAVGATQYNQALSQRRAEAVARVLIDGGLAATHITAKGLGTSVSIANNNTAEGRAKNRRVVIVVQID